MAAPFVRAEAPLQPRTGDRPKCAPTQSIGASKVERFIGRIKHYRWVAARYEKTATSYLAMVQVAAIMTLLL